MSLKCQYCNRPTELVGGDIIYEHRPDLKDKKFWICYDCDAYCGCHPGTEKPLGSVANATLRTLRGKAHGVFDKQWDTKKQRSRSYATMAKALGIPQEECHIGMFNEAQCEAVIELYRPHMPQAGDVYSSRLGWMKEYDAPFPARSARDAAELTDDEIDKAVEELVQTETKNPKPKQEKEMQHSNVVGGSTARRTLGCPNWRKEKAKNPAPQKESIYAMQGTLLHDVVAQLYEDTIASDEDFQDLKPEDFIGTTYEKAVFDQDMIDDRLLPNMQAFDDYWDHHPNMQIFVENEVAIPEIPGAFGSADIIGYDETENVLLVADWKFGQGIAVKPTENAQAGFYARGAFELPELKGKLNNETVVRLAIIQGGKMAYWDTDTDWVLDLILDLAEAVKAGDDPDGGWLEMGEWCKFCPGENRCDAQTGLARKANTDIDLSNLDNLLFWADKAPVLVDVAKNCKEELQTLLEEGVNDHRLTDVWMLTPKRGSRVYNDKEAAEKDARAIARRSSNGLKVKDVFKEPEILPPAQMEKLLKKAGVDSKKFTESNVSMHSSGNTIARVSEGKIAVPNVAALGDLAKKIGA